MANIAAKKRGLTTISFWGIFVLLMNLELVLLYLMTTDRWLTFTNSVVYGSMLVLLCISTFSIWLNASLHKQVTIHLNDLKNLGEEALIFQEVLAKYRALKTSGKAVNMPTFLEEFFTSYSFSGIFQARAVSMPKSIRLIQMFTSMTILVGVLGTFIGLVFTIGSMGSAVDTSALSGINTAFYTSIAGIGNSIAITLATRFKNTDQLLIQVMLKTENLLYETNDKSEDVQLTTVLQALTNQLQTFTNQMTAFDERLHTYTEQVNRIDEQVLQLNNAEQAMKK